MKKALVFATFSAGVFALSILGLQHVYAMGAESVVQTATPTPEEGGFLSLIMQGQWIAALGAFLTLAVAALRNEQYGLAKLVPWFATKAGGYVLGFGGAFAIYISAALQANQPVTLTVLLAALAAGWVGGGQWEGLSDLIGFLRPQPPAQVPGNVTPTPHDMPDGGGGTTLHRRGFVAALGLGTAGLVTARMAETDPPDVMHDLITKEQWAALPEAEKRKLIDEAVECVGKGIEDGKIKISVDHIECQAKDPDRWLMELDRKVKRKIGVLGTVVLMMAVVTGVACSTSCSGGPQITKVAEVVIDCVSANSVAIESLAATMLSTVLGGDSWSRVEEMAKGAGVQVGGCSLATAVQRFLGGMRALSPEQSWVARETLERYRATVAGGATFKTHAGEI